jgi:hypothetical protein
MERKKQQASASPLVGWFVTAVLLSLPSSAAARRTPPRFGGVRVHLSSRPFALRCFDDRTPHGDTARNNRTRPVATRGFNTCGSRWTREFVDLDRDPHRRSLAARVAT